MRLAENLNVLNTILVTLYVSGVVADLCVDFDQTVLSQALHVGATPKGGINAGKYNKVPDVHKLADCVKSCCAESTCNTVFLHKQACYMIECNQTAPDACAPMPRAEAKFAESYMVELRSVEETRGPDDDKKLDQLIHEDCEPEDPASCGAHADCKLELTETVIGYVCQCHQNYQLEEKTGQCTPDTSGPRSRDVSCEMGVADDCMLHEDCVTNNPRKRQGICACVKGYTRSADTGWCHLDDITKEKAEESAQTLAVDMPTKKKKVPTATLR